jgi:hypothetical protein
MIETEAIELVPNSARRESYDTSRYDVEAEKVHVRWEIHFRRESEDKPRPGDLFTGHVDDESGLVKRIRHGK